MEPTPSAILARFVADGMLDPQSRIESDGRSDVSIVYIRSTCPLHGFARRFLQALKKAGMHVHVMLPTVEALPFWRRMSAEHLVDDDPDKLQTWNDFMGALSCSMRKPDFTEQIDA